MTGQAFTPAERPSPDHTVADVLSCWPASTAIFVRRGMACPGCVMAPMMTLEEAAAAYDLEVFELIADIVETCATASA